MVASRYAGMNAETVVQEWVRRAAKRNDIKLFRNNCGVLKNAKGRLVRFGLHEGSSDLIGWRPVTITGSMVGKVIAQFVSIEVKVPGWKFDGRVSREVHQKEWLDAVNRDGGMGLFAMGDEDIEDALSNDVLRS